MTIWDQLAACVATLSEPFSAQEILSWFRRHHPATNEASIRAHIQAATSNPGGRGRVGPFAGREPLLTRVGHGRYVRFLRDSSDVRRPEPTLVPHAPHALGQAPATRDVGDRPDLILVGCSKTKATTPLPAAELFKGAGFRGAADIARSSGKPWYILSARWGLVAPAEVIAPYDVYLPDHPASVRRAWGEWVVAQLAGRHALTGATAEVHAGAAYVDPLREPARRAGLRLVTPLQGLSRGERLAWYADWRAGESPAPPPTVDAASAEGLVTECVTHLGSVSNAVGCGDLAGHRRAMDGPGLYTWWTDDAGAVELSRGVGHVVEPGLIYLGQAGATRWPSGQRSDNTLWKRISGMHLGKNSNLSTLRRTVAELLAVARGERLSEAELTSWMTAHLRVAFVTVVDRDGLLGLEARVLAELDPPLNLRHASATPLRAALATLRSSKSSGV